MANKMIVFFSSYNKEHLQFCVVLLQMLNLSFLPDFAIQIYSIDHVSVYKLVFQHAFMFYLQLYLRICNVWD